ncbi:right-handed parallel beta-helix repeat-containing protein [Algoriphagus limi]|uniref:Right-handed parallel beta-helix repeat-containing protein n=1 Tax=Algoriphagus limi TaxID=2975273 RepID=A0ABT2G129_9BACT|nr:right-handed parallel beta-helix repeat-containing protein [Algoriphagus limi]MCS5488972.1 right-handed parallel beta-helix repeat-containing protein [Algoriphagus limi]
MKKAFWTLIFIYLSTYSATIFCQEIHAIDFGIDPSGQNDNSKIINELIDSLSQKGGGIILIPEGKFLLDDAIILKSNIIFRGKSQEETIFFRNPDSGNWQNTKAQGLFTTNPSILNNGVIVEHLRVNGNFEKKASGGKGGVCLRNCTNSTIRFVTTENTWHGSAFYDYKGVKSGNLIDKVISLNAHTFTSKDNSGRPRGILVTDAGTIVKNSKSSHAGTGFYASGKDIVFENNHAEYWFEDNGYYLIVDNLRISNCSAKGGDSPEKGFGSGFAIAYKKGALIENSRAENCSNYGFRIHVPQSDTQLINNEAIGCGNGFGIEIASHPFPEVSSNLLFNNNTSERSGLHGFLFRQMSDSKIIGNKAINGNQRGVTLSTRGAIAIKEYVSNCEFEENQCFDNQSKKTQLYGLYDFSVNQITSEAKKGKNNKIKHKSTSGTDVFQ